MAQIPYAELHCHTNFSFLDGASPPDDLVERAVALGLSRAGRHRPQRPLRRGPIRLRCGGGRPASGRRSRDRAAGSGRPRPGRHRRPCPPRRGDVRVGPAVESLTPAVDRGPAAPAPPDHGPVSPDIASRSKRTCAASASGPRAAPRPACPLAGRLAEPVPARVAGEHGRHQGASRGSARPCSPSTPRDSSRCRAAATASSPVACGGRSGRGPGRRRNGTRRSSGGATGRPRAASSSSCRTISCPTTTGSCRRRRRWPRTSASRSSSPTTSTTPTARTASWRTCWPPSGTAGRSTRSATCAGRTASRS